jgi:drug/metabolite transporter (DMT)-like permease
MVFLVILYALSASSYTIGRAIFLYAEPCFFLGIRFLITGLGLLAYAWYKNNKTLIIHKKDYSRFAAIIGVHIFVAFFAELFALRDMSSFKAAFLVNISPFISVLLSYVHFGERLTSRKWLGLCIGFLGFLPELITHPPAEVGGFLFLSLAEILMFISVAATVYGWIIMRSLVQDGYSPMLVNGVGMFGGSFLSFGMSFLMQENWNPVPVSAWWPFIYLTALIVILNDVAFYNMYGALLKTYTATFMAFAGFLCPLIAALFGWIFLGEEVTWQFFISLAIVFVGLSIYYDEEISDTARIE